MKRAVAVAMTLVCVAWAAAAGGPATDAVLPRPTASERLAEIARRVQQVAPFPPIARARGLEGEALVAFEITREGAPHEIHTVRSSGSVALDRAAERAVSDAAPLPWVYGEVTVPVRFALRDPD